MRLTSPSRARSRQQPGVANPTGVMCEGLAALENEPVFTPTTRRGGASASIRSPEIVGFSHGGVVTHSSLLPIVPSAPTGSAGSV